MIWICSINIQAEGILVQAVSQPNKLIVTSPYTGSLSSKTHAVGLQREIKSIDESHRSSRWRWRRRKNQSHYTYVYTDLIVDVFVPEVIFNDPRIPNTNADKLLQNSKQRKGDCKDARLRFKWTQDTFQQNQFHLDHNLESSRTWSRMYKKKLQRYKDEYYIWIYVYNIYKDGNADKLRRAERV